MSATSNFNVYLIFKAHHPSLQHGPSNILSFQLPSVAVGMILKIIVNAAASWHYHVLNWKPLLFEQDIS